MKYTKSTRILMIVLAASAVSTAVAAGAKESTKSDAQSQDSTGAERVNVEVIKEKYWARGEETELGVVQNRTYSKTGKWTIGIYGGAVLTDPFLNVNNLGLSLGYNFSEYFSVDLLGWKEFASASSALTLFQRDKGGVVNYNEPQAYFGAEAVGSLLYGKLSVLGKSIIYFDLHVLGGFGFTKTENGTYPTPDIGLGEQIYLSKTISLRLDYRLMFYHEQIKEREIPGQIGNVVGSRNNFSNVITLGASFMFGGPKEKGKNGGSK